MRALVALCAALALAGCATAQLNEGQGLSAAQDAVASAASAVHTAYAAGVISKAQVVKATALVDQADTLSLAARQAYAAGDASTAQGDITQIVTLAATIAALKTEQSQ